MAHYGPNTTRLTDTFHYHPLLGEPTQDFSLDPVVDFPDAHAEGSQHLMSFPLTSFAHKYVSVTVVDDYANCASNPTDTIPVDLSINIPLDSNGDPTGAATTMTGYYGLDYYNCVPQEYQVINKNQVTETFNAPYPFLTDTGITQDFRHVTKFQVPELAKREYTYTFTSDTGDTFEYLHIVRKHTQIHTYWTYMLDQLLAVENSTPYLGWPGDPANWNKNDPTADGMSNHV